MTLRARRARRWAPVPTDSSGADSGTGINRFDIELPIDGFEVTVTVDAAAIERELERTISERPRDVNECGRGAFDVSKYASVSAEPTMETWDRLTESLMEEDEDNGGILCR